MEVKDVNAAVKAWRDYSEVLLSDNVDQDAVSRAYKDYREAYQKVETLVAEDTIKALALAYVDDQGDLVPLNDSKEVLDINTMLNKAEVVNNNDDNLEEKLVQQWTKDMTRILDQLMKSTLGSVLKQISTTVTGIDLGNMTFNGIESDKRFFPVLAKDAKTIEEFVAMNKGIVGNKLLSMYLSSIDLPKKLQPVKVETRLIGDDLFIPERDYGLNEQALRDEYGDAQARILLKKRRIQEELNRGDQLENLIAPTWALQVVDDVFFIHLCNKDGWSAMSSAAALIRQQDGCEDYTLRMLIGADDVVRGKFVELCGTWARVRAGDGMIRERGGGGNSRSSRSYYANVTKQSDMYRSDQTHLLQWFTSHTQMAPHPILEQFARERQAFLRNHQLGDANWDHIRANRIASVDRNSAAYAWYARMMSVESDLPRYKIVFRKL